MFLIGLMALAALIVTSVVTVELVERIQSVRVDTQRRQVQLETKLGRTRAELRSAIEELEREQRAELTAGLDSMRATQRGSAAKWTTQFENLESKLNELNSLAVRVSQMEQKSAASQATTTRLSSELAQLNREVNKLVERWMEALETGDVVAGASSVAAEDAAPDWLEHTARLTSPSAATRWNAVTALGDAKDEAVVPYLVGMLQDPDTFVRIATARILEDLGSLDAVGDLIEALTDSEVVVREVVVTALRKITDENHRFDPAAPEAERARRVKAWREWWKKNGS